MRQITKGLGFFINLANYAAGIAVALILIFKADFTSIFFVKGMSTNESLFFNMLLFVGGLALLGVVILLLAQEYREPQQIIEFPLVFEALPVIVAVISIVYGIQGETAREKLFVIGGAVAYALLSLVIIYAGAAVFQIFPKGEK